MVQKKMLHVQFKDGLSYKQLLTIVVSRMTSLGSPAAILESKGFPLVHVLVNEK